SAFDLALLDQGLPDMAGVDLLHSLARENVGVPVLMVTGVGDEDLASRVLRAGALDYVVKDESMSFLVDLPKRVGESVARHRRAPTCRRPPRRRHCHSHATGPPPPPTPPRGARPRPPPATGGTASPPPSEKAAAPRRKSTRRCGGRSSPARAGRAS